MEPYEAINLIEVVLRRLIKTSIGDDWQTQSFIDMEKLKVKQEDEVKKRRGMYASTDLLRYVEFYHLKMIIDKYWNKKNFTAALGKKKYFDTYMDRIEGFRNPTMHARPLYGFEEDLVRGIAGEIRNMTAIYRSEKDKDMQYYPTIELVTDSFHREATSAESPNSKVIVNVGDVVTFKCVATDPQDRELTWSLRIVGNHHVATQVGSEVTFEWLVQGIDVREHVLVMIAVTSNGKYHRRQGYDDRVTMYFEVPPPDGLDPNDE